MSVTDALASGETRAHLCIGCGACTSRCFLLEHLETMTPRRLVRLAGLSEEGVIRDTGFLWACTLCARCTDDCPAGVRMELVTQALRGRMTADGQAPADLLEGIRVSLEIGNNSRISRQDFVETVEWLVEEMQAEPGGENADMPLDRQGAHILFIPNPREILSLPMLLTATAQVLCAAGEDWTLSSRTYDITNWAYFTGDRDAERTIAGRIIDEAARLGAGAILSTECGHGFKILRHDARDWFPDTHRFEVLSLAETFSGYLGAGRIRLDASRNPDPVTYHDPCNLARKSGVIEPPRTVLRAAAADFREMEPHGRHNWCCGAGGGVGQIGAQTPLRLRAGRRKAEQIRATGARILVTSCQSCYQQITDLRKEHGLDIEIKSLAEMTAHALVA
ncbi:MAG: (Fe-S)-binding protein [Deltaproteobacteria bacterium]|nr:(Fe-S)-binding protein [Deltaproteobacteria bacterium]